MESIMARTAKSKAKQGASGKSKVNRRRKEVYRTITHFLDEEDLKRAGGPVAFFMAWIEQETKTKA
jgi:hypothetical protein